MLSMALMLTFMPANTAFAKAKSVPRPAKTTITSITKKNNKTIVIKWKKVTKNCKGYKIYKSTKKNKGYHCIKTITKKSTTKWTYKPTAGTKFYYAVKPYNKKNGKTKVANVKFKKIYKSFKLTVTTPNQNNRDNTSDNSSTNNNQSNQTPNTNPNNGSNNNNNNGSTTTPSTDNNQDGVIETHKNYNIERINGKKYLVLTDYACPILGLDAKYTNTGEYVVNLDDMNNWFKNYNSNIRTLTRDDMLPALLFYKPVSGKIVKEYFDIYETYESDYDGQIEAEKTASPEEKEFAASYSKNIDDLILTVTNSANVCSPKQPINTLIARMDDPNEQTTRDFKDKKERMNELLWCHYRPGVEHTYGENLKLPLD